jgi:hypothetical protein
VNARASLLTLAIALTACAAGAAQGPRHVVAREEPPAPRKRTKSAEKSAERTAEPSTGKSAARRPELPRGGRTLFPHYRLVGFCGTPGAPALGRLRGNLAARAAQLRTLAASYGDDRTVLPVFELIAVVVQGAAGADGKWRRRVPTSVIDDYLRAAREEKALLLLNIQPGHSDFLSELKELEPYLREPDVGVALDPEWAMKPRQKPGAFYGQTTGAAIDAVADYLAGIVKARDLPEKALVYHQVNGYVVKDENVLVARPGVVLVKSVDGLGPKGAKINTYNYLVKTLPTPVHAGFKLFFDEDAANGARLMTPNEVLALQPRPEYVMYE